MKITLRNCFHGTETKVITRDGNLTKTQVKRAKKKLCPSPDCQCSNGLGIKGMGYTAIVWHDGSATIKI